MNRKDDLHENIMNSLIQKHKIIANLINKKDVIYVDIPVYNNIGDLLIMLGTINFFNKHEINLKKISSFHNFFGIDIDTKDIIILQGVGNFCDLYPPLQKIKEAVIENYPKNKIIILPQTVYFKDEKNYRKCYELFSKHNDLHIFVRDNISYKLALLMSKYVYLAPDMAHQLYPIVSTNVKNKKVLFINRGDKELLVHSLDIKPDIITDWNIFLGKHNLFINFFIRIFAKLSKIKLGLKLNFLFSRILLSCWIVYSKVLVNRAIKLFSEYEIIVTNRLHGHILACLMNKKNIVYDNSYGKISSYINLWTKDSNITHFKES